MAETERPINPTTIASELNLPIKRGATARTFNEDEVVDAAVQQYWALRAYRVKRAS